MQPIKYIKIIAAILFIIMLVGCDSDDDDKDEISTSTEIIEEIDFEYVKGKLLNNSEHLIYVDTNKGSYVYDANNLSYTVTFVQTEEPVSTIEVVRENTKPLLGDEDDKWWKTKQVTFYMSQDDLKEFSKRYVQIFKRNFTLDEEPDSEK